ncbi:MAG: peptidylprolyl isomerase [Clostridiales Family XIII bacterium]|nr:peptidylprolyl isomerase [Clostridiales Family XIII bacterium]
MKNASKTKNRPIAVVLAVVVVSATLALTACGGESRSQSQPLSPSQSLSLGKTAKESGDVLKVGNVYFGQNDLDEYAKLWLNLYCMSQGIDYDAVVTDEVLEQEKTGVLDSVAQTEALRLYFAGKDVIPDSFDADLSEFKNQVFSSVFGTEERFKNLGISDKAMRYYLENNYLYEACRTEATNNGALPTEADIQAFYDEYPGEFFVGEQRRASHVLFEDAEHKPETKALAEDTLKKIKDGTAKFEDMAAQYNTDSTKDTEGDLGFAAREQFVPEFEDVMFAMNIGDISDVVETDYGYHIIKLTDIKDAGSTPLDEVRDSIRDYLAYQMSVERAREITSGTAVEYLSEKYPAPGKRPVADEPVSDDLGLAPSQDGGAGSR